MFALAADSVGYTAVRTCQQMQMLLKNPINAFNGPFPPFVLARSGNLGDVFSENNVAQSKCLYWKTYICTS